MNRWKFVRSFLVGVGACWPLVFAAVAAVDDSDLVINKQSSPATVELDSLIHYTLVISNIGPAVANNVTVSDPFPIGMFPDSIQVSPANSGSCVFNPQSSAVECDFGTMLPGQFRIVNINARAPFTGGITNTAQVFTTSTDPNTNNNSATATNLIVVLPADVAVLKSASAAFAQINQPVTFTITATNAGPGKAFSVRIQEVLPPGLTITNISAGSGTTYTTNNSIWTIPTLASNSSTVLLITGFRTAAGNVTNTAYIASQSNNDPNRNNNTNRAIVTWVAGLSADLELSMKGPQNQLTLSDTAAFIVLITNRGPNTTSNVFVQVFSWFGFQFVNATAAPIISGFDSSTRRWNVGAIAPGAAYDLQLFLRPTNFGTFTVTAEIFSSALSDPDSTPNNLVGSEDDQTSANATTARSYSIGGVIQDGAGAGAFLTNMLVDVEGASLPGQVTYQTDALSSWSVTNLFAGTYTLTPRKFGYAFTPTNRTATIINSDVTGVNFVIESLPRLDVHRSGTNVLLSWPVAATNYHLQGGISVLGPWTNVTNTPLLNGGNNEVQLPAVATNRMFRLIKP